MSLVTLSPTILPALSIVTANRPLPPEPASKLHADTNPVEHSSYFASASFKRPPILSRPTGVRRHIQISSPATAAAVSAPMSLKTARTSGDVWEVSDDDLGNEEGETIAQVQQATGLSRSKVLKVARVKSKTEKKTEPIGTKARKSARSGSKENGPAVHGAILAAKITKPCAKKRTSKLRSRSPDEPLGLEMGVTRRMDWTPPKARTHAVIDLLDSPEDDGQALENGVRVRRHNSFQSLLGGYNYGTDKGKEEDRHELKLSTSAIQPPPMKRRKLDMIESTVPTKPLAVITKKDLMKVKAPKKKARTITAVATADFMPIDDVLDADGDASLMDSFLTTQRQNCVANEENVSTAVPTATGRRKSRVTKTKPAPRSKVLPASRLLAPELAIDAAESQELLFGTSSQLIREDSPTFIRDLQTALKESEVSASQQEADRELSGSEQSRYRQGRKNLWAAARRGANGELLEAETIDLSKTPRPLSRRTSRLSGVCLETGDGVAAGGAFAATPVLLAPTKPVLPQQDDQGNDFTTDASILKMDQDSPHFLPPSHPQLQTPISLDREDSTISLPKSIAEAACRTRPRSKSPAKKAPRKAKQQPADADSATPKPTPKPKAKSKSKATTKTKTKDGQSEPKSPVKRAKTKDKADFNTWTVPELTKKIKSYGFKAVKGKSAMVALLEKCRESQGEREGKKKEIAEEKEKMKEAHQGGEDELASRHFATDDGDVAVVEKPKVKKATKAKTKKKDQETDAIATVDAPAPTTPKKRGRPRKTTLETSTPSDPAPSKSPRKKATPKSKPQTPSLALPANTSTSTSNSTAATPTDTNLLLAITTAITSFPPTHDPKNPTWHERILMYDPIVLEDLCVWLNTEGLGAVGVDEEVWPGLVRTWCEERSVCCLWRENLRGGKRARY